MLAMTLAIDPLLSMMNTTSVGPHCCALTGAAVPRANRNTAATKAPGRNTHPFTIGVSLPTAAPAGWIFICLNCNRRYPRGEEKTSDGRCRPLVDSAVHSVRVIRE